MTTRRGKCGGRAGRRLGTPRATEARCSPRLHKPCWPGGATPRKAVPQPPAAPRARDASGSRAPRAPAPHGPPGRSDSSSKPLPGPSFFPSLRLPLRKGRSSPLQSSLTTRGATSTRWGGRGEEEAGVRSAARPPYPAGKLRGRVPSSRGGG